MKYSTLIKENRLLTRQLNAFKSQMTAIKAKENLPQPNNPTLNTSTSSVQPVSPKKEINKPMSSTASTAPIKSELSVANLPKPRSILVYLSYLLY